MSRIPLFLDLKCDRCPAILQRGLDESLDDFNARAVVRGWTLGPIDVCPAHAFGESGGAS